MNPVDGPADHEVPVLSLERMRPLVDPAPEPVAISLRPVYVISEARVSVVECDTVDQDAVAALDASVVIIWLFPSPAKNHLLPVNAIPIPSPEKQIEFDSRTLRHVPAPPLTSRE